MHDRKDHRFRAQVYPCERIGRVAVRRYNGCVFVREDIRFVLELIERSLELRRVMIDGVLIHRGVVHHYGQAVHEPSSAMSLIALVCALTGTGLVPTAVIAPRAVERRRSRFVSI